MFIIPVLCILFLSLFLLLSVLSNEITGITGNAIIDVDQESMTQKNTEHKEIVIVDEEAKPDVDGAETEEETSEETETESTTSKRRFYSSSGGGSSSRSSGSSSGGSSNSDSSNDDNAEESDIEFVNILRKSGKTKSSLPPPSIPI